MKKVTVGQQIQEHKNKNLALEDDTREYTQLMSPEIWNNILEAIKDAKTRPQYNNKNIYIQLLHFKEPIQQQLITKTFARLSCPTPAYNQSVLRYNHAVGDITFLWTLPNRVLYDDMVKNPRDYRDDPTQRDRAEFVWADYTGELMKLVHRENGEKPDAVIYNCKERACLAKMNN